MDDNALSMHPNVVSKAHSLYFLEEQVNIFFISGALQVRLDSHIRD